MNKNLNDINIIVEVIIKLNNKLYKLIMKIQYTKINSKIKYYFKYKSCYGKRLQTNR